MVRQPAVEVQTVGAFAETFEAVIDNVAQVLRGQRRPDPAGPGVPGRRRPPAARGRAGRRQDQPGQGAGPVVRPAVAAHPVHARPAALRRDGRQRLRPGYRDRSRFRPGRRLRQRGPRRRDQPGLAQDPVGPARGDAGAAGHGRQRDPPPADPVPGHRHPEPGRARGHLSAAREPARPVPVARPDGLPGPPAPRWPCSTGTESRHAGRRPVAGGRPRRHYRPWSPLPPRCTWPMALKGYIVDLATATRNHPALSLGMSPTGRPGAAAGRPGPGAPPPGASTSCPTTSSTWPGRYWSIAWSFRPEGVVSWRRHRRGGRRGPPQRASPVRAGSEADGRRPGRASPIAGLGAPGRVAPPRRRGASCSGSRSCTRSPRPAWS